MKPPAFDFLRPDSPAEVLAALAEYRGDATLIGGGQSLVPMLNMRLARPKLLIDTMRLTDLAVIREAAGKVRIGLGVRQAQLENWPDLSARLPLLARAIPWIGHVQTRARGTVCGSVAHADPSAELPLCLVTLGGEVHLRSRKKARTLAAAEFFTGMMATAKHDDEMIEAVSYPVAAPGTGYAYHEIGRRHGDFAIVGLAAVVGPAGARLGVAGVDDFPRCFDLPLPGDAGLADALNEVAWSLNARDDNHASARYRREMVRRLGHRVLKEAASCRH